MTLLGSTGLQRLSDTGDQELAAIDSGMSNPLRRQIFGEFTAAVNNWGG